MNDKNFIRALREIQKSALQIQQATMELLEELQENDISADLPNEVRESHLLADDVVQQPLIQKIFALLPENRNQAMTIDEIEKHLPDVSSYSIQTPLNDLLADGLITREMREDEADKRKNAWEYWKTGKNEPIFDAKRQSVNRYAIIYYLPEKKEDALSVLEIAQKLDVPKSTVRDALRKLREENMVQSFESKNDKNQKTERYYYKHF